MVTSAMSPARKRSKILTAVIATVRVLFTTLLFTAGGMGLGLLLGIIGMVLFGLITGTDVDMRNAYRHFAIPVAAVLGTVAFMGAILLEVRHRRT